MLIRFPDIELNPGPRNTPVRTRVLFNNINGLSCNIKDLAVASTRYDILLCAETKVSSYRNIAELRIPKFNKPVQILRGARPNGLGLALYVRDGVSITRMLQYECRCCEMMVVRLCSTRQNFYLICVYRSPNTDDRIYDCLLSSMGQIQSLDRKAVFCFLGDFNAHHKDYLGSPRTDGHGKNLWDFATNSDCTQLVTGPTHRGGGTLDLVLTNVPDLCRVTTNGPIGNSDHSSISTTILTHQHVPNFCVSKTVYQKSRIAWDSVRDAFTNLPWSEVIGSDHPVTLLNQHISSIIRQHVPKTTIKIRNNDEPWFDKHCRLAFDRKQTAYLRWNRLRTNDSWQQFVESQREANEHCNECYSRAQRNYNTRCQGKLNESTNPHKWWQTLKNTVFGRTSSSPPLIRPGGELVTHPQEKADLLSGFFDSKQSRDFIDLPATCHIEPAFTSIAFRAREVGRLLGDLDSFGGVDPLGHFPLLFKECRDVIAPKLTTLFRKLIRSGSFPIEWRSANVTPIPKGAPSANPSDYRPISITSVVSKVFEKLIADRLSKYIENSGFACPNQFAYRKGLGTCDALLTISEICQKALDAGQEIRLIQVDFSAAFDRVNHAGIIHKLQEVGVGGSLLSIFREYLTNRSQTVLVDGQSSRQVNIVSGVPQGSVLGPLLYNIYTRELVNILENTFVGYADDSTLLAVIPSPKNRVEVARSLIRDMVRLHAWCKVWCMSMNLSKTKAMLISRSQTLLPYHPDIAIHDIILENVKELRILGLILDTKLTFEQHVRSIVSSIVQKLGILRIAWSIYQDPALIARCFWSLILPIAEYCSPVWRSAVDGHLNLLDSVVRKVTRMSQGSVQCDLWHRRDVAALCMLFKIRANAKHLLHPRLPQPYVAPRALRNQGRRHPHQLTPVRCRTEQYQRAFIPCITNLWNNLSQDVTFDSGLQRFKMTTHRHLLLV